MKNLKRLAVVGMTMAMVFGSTVTAFAANTYTVTGTKNFLALRNEKCYDPYNIIGKLYNGDTVDVIDSTGTYWTVRTNDGCTGYVDGRYLSRGTGSVSYCGTYVVSGTRHYLALRSAPGYDARNEIGKLYNGDTVDVLEATGSYWFVRTSSGRTGYVDARYLNGYMDSTPSCGTYVVSGTKHYLALRSAPAYDARNEIGKLYDGDYVEVINASGRYWKVNAYGRTGYVDSRFLR